MLSHLVPRCAAASFVLLLVSGASAQTTHHVDGRNPGCPGAGTPASPYCTIQQGIEAASDGDTVLVMPGTYGEAIDFLGKAITVQGQAEPHDTIIDGTGFGSVVTFDDGEGRSSILRGLTVRNGQGSVQLGVGGGILCLNTSPTIADVVLSGNQARNGGGIYGQGSNCLMTDVRFAGNTAANSSLSNGGAAQFINSTPTFLGCVFTNNSAVHTGGAINVRGSTAFLANCVFDSNSAIDAGGAIRIGALSSGNLVSCSFYGNASPGRFFQGAQTGGGGGLAAGSDTPGPIGTVTITNSIFWGNTAFLGEELAVAGIYPTNLVISNSNVRGGQSGVFICPPSLCSGFVGGPYLSWNEGMMDADPQFIDPAAGDFHLLHTSPCRDAGDSQAAGLQATDVEGDPRVVGGAVDMGADEFHRHLYVTGQATAGNTIAIKIIGSPGDLALLVIGAGVLPQPLPSPYGAWYLGFPILAVLPLGTIGAGGVTVLPVAISPGLTPAALPMQGATQLMLTNLEMLRIE